MRPTLTRACGGPRELGCAVRAWWSMSPVTLLSLLSAACTGPGANNCSVQHWGCHGTKWPGGAAAVAGKGELALIVLVEEFCGCSGPLRQEQVQPVHLPLKAEVGITILKPSDTRSFNRGKKTHYLDRRTCAY